MTYEEALKIIIKNLVVAIHDWDEPTNEYQKEQAEGFYKAKEALEKQIPKKPRKQVIDLYLSKATEVLCPVCNKSVCTWITLDSHSKKKPFCPNCGQALDWGDEK